MNDAGQKREKKLRPRQVEFAALVAAGTSQAEAYRRVYKPKNRSSKFLAKRGNRTASFAGVREEIDRIRNRREVKKLLTLNDRLEILSGLAQNPKNRPHEVARAIEVYSKISGDQAPERHEVSAPGGGPIQVAATATVSVSRIPVRERMRLMREARAAAKPEAAP